MLNESALTRMLTTEFSMLLVIVILQLPVLYRIAAPAFSLDGGEMAFRNAKLDYGTKVGETHTLIAALSLACRRGCDYKTKHDNDTANLGGDLALQKGFTPSVPRHSKQLPLHCDCRSVYGIFQQ